MKKIFIMFLISLSFCINVFGASQKYKEVERLQIEAKGSGLSKDLIISCKEKLKSNLNELTDFYIIDTDNEEYMLDTQRNISKSFNYSDASQMEGGNWSVPTHILVMSIDKINGVYTVEAKITSFRTNKIVAVVQKTSRNNISQDDLYINPGCLIDEITLDLCKKLDYPLTQDDITYLSSNSNVGNEEYDEIIHDIENTLNSLRKEENRALNNPKEKAKLSLIRANIAKKEAELKQAKDKKASAIEEARRERDEANERANRDAENEIFVQQILANTSSSKISSSTNDFKEALITIEEYKRQYRKLQEDIQAIFKRNEQKAEEEKQYYYKSIIQKAPGLLETDSKGNITNEAKVKRQVEYEEKCQEIDADLEIQNENLLHAKSSNGKSLAQLKSLITKNYNDFCSSISNKTYTVTNKDYLNVEYGQYDGDEERWPVTCYFDVDDNILSEKSFNISYSDLTGKHSDNSDNYYDTIDKYDNYFSKGMEILSFYLTLKIRTTPINDDITASLNFIDLYYTSPENPKKISLGVLLPINVQVSKYNAIEHATYGYGSYDDSDDFDFSFGFNEYEEYDDGTHHYLSTGRLFKASDTTKEYVSGFMVNAGGGGFIGNYAGGNLQFKASLILNMFYPYTFLFEDCVDISTGVVNSKKSKIAPKGTKMNIVSNVFQVCFQGPALFKDESRWLISLPLGLGFAKVNYHVNEQTISKFGFVGKLGVEATYRIVPVVDFYGLLDWRLLFVDGVLDNDLAVSRLARVNDSEKEKEPSETISTLGVTLGVSIRLIW